MRKETTARAAGGTGLSHTEICAVSEFTPVNRRKMEFLVCASECSTEWYLALMAPKPFFFSAQENIFKLPDSVNESNYQN